MRATGVARRSFARTALAGRSFALAALVTVATMACAASLPACGRDYDALFGDDGGPGGGSVDTGVVPDTGAVDGGADTSVAADTGAPGCVKTPPCAAPTSGCDGGRCVYRCTGCECNCTAYDCPKSDGITRCDTVCDEGSSCEIRCLGTINCAGTCATGASCVFRCQGTGSCNLTCAGGALLDCGGGVFACRQACPL